MQARWVGHSVLIVHSGLHSMYGFPCRPGTHLHEAAPLFSRHSALRPQGDGLQGSIISGRRVVAEKKIITFRIKLLKAAKTHLFFEYIEKRDLQKILARKRK